ncbi:MAG TPA: type I-U CRISPR-associated helicase/endonuclease Cas3 [Planctomycetota bacterium]|nr:type I-U CRISPR-associated helicase/endonuclease Cas3 [Planctomycetota bacterium]
MSYVPDFPSCFEALTGYRPLRWQVRFFNRLLTGDVPPSCDLPTGLGKTSVIPIWLLALVFQDRASCKPLLPRRLVYIVDRRTVVDQATEIVETIRRRLRQPQASPLAWVKERLELFATGSSENVIGVSTLRGELADNQEWKADPARPAIIVGTIDMVGSKLLFSGYGDGRYLRAHHAGLIGQDALIVHDEAHLTPAFGNLLHSLAAEQLREMKNNAGERGVMRPIRILELSATSRRSPAGMFTLEAEDLKDPIVQDRLHASKLLHLHAASPEMLESEITRLASRHKDTRTRILIFVRSPDSVRQIARDLEKALGAGGSERIGVLTGTIRGHERDQLLQRPPASAAAQVLQHFMEGVRPATSVYLICTSAGEVGIDLDADHMVCDLTTLDGLIQRLGRVNRRGGKDRQSQVDVVFAVPEKEEKLSEFEKAVLATHNILRKEIQQQGEAIDASPEALRRLIHNLSETERVAAFSPKAETLPLTDILLDGWSLTSVHDLPGVPEVAPFLHGLTPQDPAETFIAWRWEVDRLAEAKVHEDDLAAWFRACPIEAQERLRDRTERVSRELEKLLKRHRQADRDADFPLIVLDERGKAKWKRLSNLSGTELAFRTLVLPPRLGGLNASGMLDSASEGAAADVAEKPKSPEKRQRWVCRSSHEDIRYESLDPETELEGPPEELREKLRIPLSSGEDQNETGERVDLVLFVSPRRSASEDPETASARQTLEEHSRSTAEQMAAIAGRLDLPQAIQEALVLAARWHDKGKDRPIWQTYAGNRNGGEILAKAERYLHPRTLGGYRHEFGSLLDARTDAEIRQHPERDLVLHLIAAHHGWARPHFEPQAYDRQGSGRDGRHPPTTRENVSANIETFRRFARLQKRFGRWGLAWLESLLRCADIAASKAAAAGHDAARPTVEASA